MANKQDVWQGTLALMILKTLETMGPQHGYGIARRIEQTSGHRLLVNYGTLYPALLKLEQEGYVASAWGVSDNNRRAKYYQLTRAGQEAGRSRGERVGADDGDSGQVPGARGSVLAVTSPSTSLSAVRPSSASSAPTRPSSPPPTAAASVAPRARPLF